MPPLGYRKPDSFKGIMRGARLPVEVDAELVARAERDGESLAEVHRKAIAQYLYPNGYPNGNGSNGNGHKK